MKLVISEYLSMLKESGELDLLIPDLLLSMSAETISYPQKGPRQYGVDIAAISSHEGGVKALYLFVVKQGDIGRKDWDGGQQSVRQSLDEIKDVYINSHIDVKHSKLKKKIIVCSGGKIKQEVQQNWKWYVENNTVSSEREYDFWGSDKLSLLIEEYMFNEKLLPKPLQSKIRKTLALLGDSDHDVSDYYYAINELLLDSNLENQSIKKVERALLTVQLCLNMIFSWSKQQNNLKPVLLCSERTILTSWEFIRRNKYFSEKRVMAVFSSMFITLFSVYSDYFNKMQQHCYVEDGLIGYGGNFILESLNVFEVLGVVSVAGNLYLFQSVAENNKELYESAAVITDALQALIDNHLITRTPCYDNHIIEISCAISLLHAMNRIDFIDAWIRSMVDHIAFSYRSLGCNFPIQTDSFNDAVELNVSKSIMKEKMMEMSTLLPTLAQWCAALGLTETYTFIRNVVSKVFSNCDLQVWYPDKKTDEYLYMCNAAYNSGASDAPINLPENIDDFKRSLENVQKNTIEPKDVSAVGYGRPILPMIASRHFRTPLLPFYWQATFIGENGITTDASSEADESAEAKS